MIRLRGRVIDENLAHALPNLSAAARKRLARRMWEHLFLLVWEVAHAPRKIHETNWREYIRLSDVAPLLRAMISGRPVIIVTAHFGNFELGGYGLGILGFPTYSVARPLDNRYLDRFLTRFRGATGQHLIPKNGGSAQIEHVLSHGGVMAFLADQYGGEKGCWVDFFGRPASVYKAIALLALEYDALMAVCTSPRARRTHAVRNGLGRHPRSARRGQRGEQRPTAYAVVYGAVGSGHPPPSGTILVAASALEGHAEAAGPTPQGGVREGKGLGIRDGKRAACVFALCLPPSAIRLSSSSPGLRKTLPWPVCWKFSLRYIPKAGDVVLHRLGLDRRNALAGELPKRLAEQKDGQPATPVGLVHVQVDQRVVRLGLEVRVSSMLRKVAVAKVGPPPRGTRAKRVKSNSPRMQASHHVRDGGSTATSTTI